MDIIQLLPDSVANQIAAGEVIQRPSSVIKELVENSIDAESSDISILVKDAGRALIQVIDNGKGMSETDARMAFERHATSKITCADDLFRLKTMGFRGEALASIAAVASIELKTRNRASELGTRIVINGSDLELHESISCAAGSNFSVKNLFFNVPARRKFLKSNTSEFRNIITDFQRIALVYPQIQFSLTHNETLVYKLPATNLKQRISDIFKKNIQKNLISIESESTLAKITGFIGLPEFAHKTGNHQFFFVNGRFMKHFNFHKAVLNTYEKILQAGTQPSYFIYFQVEPSTIDVNIHPTKTEIKFENEQILFQILQSVVRQSLGKFNVVPSIDFDTEDKIDIPYLSKNSEFSLPTVDFNPNYNPFDTDLPKKKNSFKKDDFLEKANLENWENLYQDFEKQTIETNEEDYLQTQIFENKEKLFLNNENLQVLNLLQIKNMYILSPVKSGLMLIHQKRAHEKILYEQIIQQLENEISHSQGILFPVQYELSFEDLELFNEIKDDLQIMGFEIAFFGRNTIVFSGFPSFVDAANGIKIFERLFAEYKNFDKNIKENLREELAKTLANVSSMKIGKTLNMKEMQELIDGLFACPNPNYSPNGKKIIHILNIEEMDKFF
jgi:DNA mismatch repair protein MutL